MTPKALLAPNKIVSFDTHFITYPALVSPKLDGNRLLICDGVCYTRSGKIQANTKLPIYLQALITLGKELGLMWDCELYSDVLSFRLLQTIVRSYTKLIPYHVKAYVFDAIPYTKQGLDKGFWFLHRNNLCMRHLVDIPNCMPLGHTQVKTPEEAREKYSEYLDLGYEGLMLRSIDGEYKQGRATLREGIIFKFKETRTEDGRIIEVIEKKKMIEGLKRTVDVHGYLERDHKKDHYELAGTVGALRVKLANGKEVKIGFGKGWNQDRRYWEVWQERHNILGKWVEFTYMPYGTTNLPRMGRLKRFRPDLDME